MQLTERENFLRALRREEPQWVPYSIWLAPDLEERYKKHVGEEEFRRRFRAAWDHPRSRGRGPRRQRRRPTWEDFKKYYEGEDIPEGVEPNAYGVIRVPGDFYHFTHMLNPMRHFTTAQEVYDYPWPEQPPLEDEDYIRQLKEKAEETKARGKAVMGGSGGLFELGWSMRGLDKMLEDFATDGEVSRTILDILTDRAVRGARASALAGADLLGTGDDVGMQTGLMMSPETWRKWLKPRTGAIFRAAKEVKPDIQIRYHTDGNVESIIEDFIEIGVDSLNPLEAKAGLDVVELRRRLGHRLGFCGNMDVITWANGSEDELKKVVLTKLNAAKGGGFIFQSDHSVPTEVSGHNYDYVVKLVREYGKYPLELGEYDIPELG